MPLFIYTFVHPAIGFIILYLSSLIELVSSTLCLELLTEECMVILVTSHISLLHERMEPAIMETIQAE
jgi:hypothetical protein